MSRLAGSLTGGRRHARTVATASVGVAALVGAVLLAVPAHAAPPAPAAHTAAIAEALASTPTDAATPATFAPVPSARVKNDYDQQLFTPPTGGDPATYTVYQSNVDTTVTPHVTYYTAITPAGDGTVALNDGLVLDLATGKVSAKAVDLRGTDSDPSSYIVVVNNGVGGATAASEGTSYGESGGYTEIPVAVGDVSSGPFSIPVLFTDVALDNLFATPIYQLSGVGVMAGYADGSFQPTSPVTRQAFARFAVQLLSHGEYGPGPRPCTTVGLGYLGLSAPYNDVSWLSPFCMDIMILSYLGVAQGYPDGGFHPRAPISRQGIAAMTFRLYGVGVFGDIAGDAACTEPIPFNDVTSSNPFCGDIEWLHANGLSNGYGDGGYHPTADASRQATAAFLYRFYLKYGADLNMTGPVGPSGPLGAGAQVNKALAATA